MTPSFYIDTKPPAEPADTRELNAEVREKHARQRQAMGMWDEMIVYMEGVEPDSHNDRKLFRNRLAGTNQQVKQ
ncbi:MAG: hypothetical protein OXF73_12670 [Gammaproteobacteria bacterium]|nr:hypothetical protein [Gammaproteobacteria bacterium]